jgi:plastocyanin
VSHLETNTKEPHETHRRTFDLCSNRHRVARRGSRYGETDSHAERRQRDRSGQRPQYNTKVLRSHPGKIKLVFTNLSTIRHNVRIESGENELGGTKTIGKGKAVAYVNLKKGTYNFYCSVPGHEDAGMKGKLVVS